MQENAMSIGEKHHPEKTSYTDAETGRKVALWTAPHAQHNMGLYYHQNPFDAQRNLVYFISSRTDTRQNALHCA